MQRGFASGAGIPKGWPHPVKVGPERLQPIPAKQGWPQCKPSVLSWYSLLVLGGVGPVKLLQVPEVCLAVAY